MISTIGFNATACPPALRLLQIAGNSALRCSYTHDFPLHRRPDDACSTELTISAPYDAHSLPALLRCLRPIGVPAVQRLKLGHCALDMAALAHCSELAALTHISLRCMTAANDDWEAALAGLLRQAPLLSSL